ncbi:hypothetical protein RFI_14048 [Reticulomyxa filosa]|uniref:Uncharacterized protein n=1 Tax=Reticulomyxa filosa TaxID=46433 RepID=X6NAR8_RETFI|nr:hypothetical protein RFI_14048 [Reticulomyxa filosa]|eukprot:ETO23136.1 hypothetical protein RFI_14048 [Reticulomyxa filosa]
MVAAVKAEQINVQNIAADPNTKELDVVHAFAVNEVLMQVLADYEALASGKKRRYEEQLNISEMAEYADVEYAEANDFKANDNDDNVNDIDYDLADVELHALEPPPTEANSSKREILNKKNPTDLLGLNTSEKETNATSSYAVDNKDNEGKDKDGNANDIFDFLTQPINDSKKAQSSSSSLSQPLQSGSRDPNTNNSTQTSCDNKKTM